MVLFHMNIHRGLFTGGGNCGDPRPEHVGKQIRERYLNGGEGGLSVYFNKKPILRVFSKLRNFFGIGAAPLYIIYPVRERVGLCDF